MSKVAVTGSRGFLGWHLRCALQDFGADVASIRLGGEFDLGAATGAVDRAARAIHLAGVNRASDHEVSEGNVLLAEQLATALRAADAPPPVVVFANSIQAGNGSVYGEAKLRAAQVLAAAASDIGADFIDVRLPNLFGEHGRPFYNAVTATFSHLIAAGERPTVINDRQLTLLHAQDAVDILAGVRSLSALGSMQRTETVSGLLARLMGYAELYERGDVPDLTDDFDRDLFNTYRSYTFPSHAPIGLSRHADARGSFFEIVRSHGGPGQSSFSTTLPGVIRGDHFHRRKVERFTILQGRARISLRRLHTTQVVSFEISGDEPGAVDMPTMWAHNIANIGEEPLYTSFWTNDIFDPSHPDTIAEAV